ncbi:NAD(P)/FAD-dependent oxidoreductase [Arsenicicoccus sp. MKL-02]|uniref:NAD(P)/FAD-dependent oxidoreductase n=1 Tax=Arsenicicoccus cauae TaxID=2663847 RepID=A0A6I3IE86_9MICO|nr:FAD-dependent oxidoreductase [Arsenicicoccus cauae]MTB72588.1 NAD(P)/FAD-dependent oxidoreductase [Arsenicicoccus cauae]
MSHGLVVVGSGPAGVSAAQAYSDAGGPGPVTILTADEHPPYQRPPLSKDVLRGELAPEPVAIDGADPELAGITVELRTRVNRIDPDARVVHAGGREIPYAALVLASGATPTPLPTAEPDADVHLLRSLADAERLVEAASHAHSAVVIGSGFIGCEAAVSLARRGIDVTVVTTEQAPQVARLGDRASQLLTDWLAEEGVALVTGGEVTSVRAPREVHLSDGTTRSPDLVLAALGVAPSTDYLAGTGISTHEGRVVVDDRLRTSVDGVWAAGDVTRAHNAAAGRPLHVEHWGDALTMGEIAGRNAAGADESWTAVPGFWSEIGDRTLKHVAWGDGFDEVRVVERPGGLTVWYAQDGVVVGALTYEADDDYKRAEQLVTEGASIDEV